jgi:hypothetical protein
MKIALECNTDPWDAKWWYSFEDEIDWGEDYQR